jgi:predicted nucleic acid-binding protein
MIAVDTNVLIYACDQADPRRQQIALDLVTNTDDGVLLWQVACEFIAASRNLSKQGFTSTQAWNRLASSGNYCLLCWSRNHLVEHTSQRPNVRPFVRWPSLRLLGRHVRSRAENHADAGHRRRARNRR